MADEVMTGQDPVNNVPDEHEDGGPEPLGAQILRRMHKDATLLMQEYDEMMGPLEHEGVSGHLQQKLESLEAELTEIEELWNEHYSELEGLENADEKDMGDDGSEEDAAPADSEEEEEPTEEEAVEGMQAGKAYGSGMYTSARTGGAIARGAAAAGRAAGKVAGAVRAHPKTAAAVGGAAAAGAGAAAGYKVGKKRGAHQGKAMEEEEEEKSLGDTARAAVHHAGAGNIRKAAKVVGQAASRVARAHPKTTAAVAGGAAGVAAGRMSKRKGFPEMEDLDEETEVQTKSDPAMVPGYEENQAAEHSGDQPDTGGAQGPGSVVFKEHHGPAMKEAHGFLSEIANTRTPDFNIDHQKKAYHFHKSLESIVGDLTGMPSSKSVGGAVRGAIGGLGGPVGGAVMGAMGSSLEAAKQGKKSGDPEEVPGYEGHQDKPGHEGSEGDIMPLEANNHPHISALANASSHLRDLSETRSFGDDHREKSLACAKALDPVIREAERSEVNDEEGDDEGLEEPGAMGEKALNYGEEAKELDDKVHKEAVALNNRMRHLNSLLGR